MRTLTMAVPAALLLAAPYVGAQSLDYPRTDQAPVSTVQVPPPARGILVTSDQAEAIKGTYEMSNGWNLKVQPIAASHSLIAQIDQQPPMRLTAMPGDRFVSNDGNVAMTFKLGSFQDEMSMSYVPSSSLAEANPERVTIASR